MAALRTSTGGRHWDEVKGAASRIFSSRNQRIDPQAILAEGADQASLEPASPRFHTGVEQSFLPAMLQIARDHNTRLIFFRVKCRATFFPPNERESSELQQYMQELGTFLASQGSLLVDETSDPEVTLDYYGGDDHVRDEMMPAYTRLFERKMRPFVEASVRGSPSPDR